MPWSARGEKLYEGEMMKKFSDEYKEHVRVYGINNDTAVRTLNLCDDLKEEVARLRSALQFIANHTAELGTAFETVVKFAAATLEPPP